MKKRIIASVLTTMLIVTALSGCGGNDQEFEKKNDKMMKPTAAEIMQNVNTDDITQFSGSMNFDVTGGIGFSDIDPDSQMFMDTIADELGFELAEGLDLSAGIDLDFVGEKNDLASHVKMDGNMNVSTNSAELNASITESTDSNTSIFGEFYTDFQEKVEYEYDQDTDTWYASEYVEKDMSKVKDVDFEHVFELLDTAGDVSEVVFENDTYSFDVALTISNDMTEDQKNAVRELAKIGAEAGLVEADEKYKDLELDPDAGEPEEEKDIFETLMQVSEYGTLEMPVSVKFDFKKVGDKYNIDSMDIAAGLAFGAIFDAEKVGEFTGKVVGMAVKFVADVDLGCDIVADFDFGYDPVDVSIPAEIIGNAVDSMSEVIVAD